MLDKVSLGDAITAIRAQLRLSDFVRKKVVLTLKGGRWSGLCPFHQEKTPSFTVSDVKGLYHCFGCNASGDIFNFLQQTENLSFVDAVKMLAPVAGITLAQHSQAADASKKDLYAILQAAADWYHQRLLGDQGWQARQYLATRRLPESAWDQFHLGFSPMDASLLPSYLLKQGWASSLLSDAGLTSNQYPTRDRFFGRLIFPITDARGRVVGFGGRAFLPDHHTQAKYLNSPETDVFHKKTLLYGYFQAQHSAKSLPVALVEGYFDVISLTHAGLTRAVAPLGTAAGEAHIQQAWNLSPEPILAFDGDAAGLRATERLYPVILPMLKPGYSVRVATLPTGQDPDSLIQSGQTPVVQQVLDHSLSMLDALWQRAFPEGNITPEQQALAWKDLRASVGTIKDNDVKSFYQQACWERFRDRHRLKKKTVTAKDAGMVSRQHPDAQAQVLLGLALHYPFLLHQVQESLGQVSFHDPSLQGLKEDLLKWFHEKKDVTWQDDASLQQATKHSKMIEVLSGVMTMNGFLPRSGTDPDQIASAWSSCWHHYYTQCLLDKEVIKTAQELCTSFSQQDWKRLQQLKVLSLEE